MRSAWLLCVVIVAFGIATAWAQAPAAPDSESAVLREQVATLKKALADKQKEVDILKDRLAALEGQIAPTTLDGFFKAVWDSNLAAVRAGLALNPHWLDIEKDNGDFPLECAVRAGRKEMVEFLLAKGAWLDSKDSTGKRRPIEIRDPEISAIFVKYGATLTRKPGDVRTQPVEGGGTMRIGVIR